MSERICTVPNCSKRHSHRGYCQMHFSRVRRHGDPGWEDRRAPAGAGHVNPSGYRVVWRPGHPVGYKHGTVLEHRAVLYDAIGDGPHPCEWCADPLEWVDIAVDHLDFDRLNNTLGNLVVACRPCNTRRTDRHRKGESVPTSKLTADQVTRIRASSEPVRIMAERFGVSVTTAQRIRLGRSWAHILDGPPLESQGAPQDRGHCPQGHPYDEANTAIRSGKRYCRACQRERARVARERKKCA